MNETAIILLPVILPVLLGFLLLVMRVPANRKILIGITAAGLFLTGGLVVWILCQGELFYTLFYLTKTLPVYFKIDGIGRVFAGIVIIIWTCAGIFAFEYMKHEECNKRYFGFYLIVLGVLIGLDFSGNLITFYFFYECMTLMSVPLVLHSRSREAVMAGLKYLLYSFCGAYMVLFGIYFLNRFGNTLSFTPGGVLNAELIRGNEAFLLFVAFLMIIGFGVKAGMFPLHAWLPVAHPAAPAPASAALSGIIVKSGVLGLIRTVYYLFGTEFLRGTWVQTSWLGLTLITIFMGSMLAYREPVLKKRLAYSTVSQISYILYGLALMNSIAMEGALYHTVFHAFIKCGLFLCAGAIIYQTGKTRVDQLRGIGKEMPVTIWCFTLLSLALIGIPPASGFVSKWNLAVGALQSGTAIFTWLGPVVLLISALLTAGYLLPVTVNGFFPGADYDYQKLVKKEPVKTMWIPIMILTILAIFLGMFPTELGNYFSGIVSQLI